jgi:hypothetical protein
MRNLSLTLLLALFVTACGNDRNYLYREVLPSTQSFTSTYNVKEAIKRDKVDILWVIDNSGSMGSYQNAVKSNLSLFMQQFTSRQNVDWKMGLISTDESQAPFSGFDFKLDSTVPTQVAVNAFQMAISQLGTSGSATEKSFGPVMKVLDEYDGTKLYTQTGTTVKPKFLRDGAYLVIFFVTDEREQTEGVTAQDFHQYLVDQKGDPKFVKAYGAIGSRDLGCSSGDDYYGETFEEMITLANGRSFAACSMNFGLELAKVGGEIVEQLEKPSIFLEHRPIPSTIRIVYEPISREKEKEVLPGGAPSTGGHWIYNPDTNAIEFHNLNFAPGEEEYVNITYEIDDGYDRN